MKSRFKVYMLISLLCSIVFLLFGAWADSYYVTAPNASGHAFNLGGLGDIILSIIKGLGIAATTTTLMSWVKIRIESPDYLIKYDFLKIMSDIELQELKLKIQKILYFKKSNYSKDNIYDFFDEQISSLLGKSYYEYYHQVIKCNIQENCIIKTIDTKFKLVNPTSEPIKDTIPFEAEMQKVEGYPIENLYQITKFEIKSNNNIDIKTDVISKNIVIKDKGDNCNDAYSVSVSTAWDFNVDKYCIVDMAVTTVVPVTDVNYSNQVTKPCKSYQLTFIKDSPLYDVSGYNFGYMRKDNEEEYEERVICQSVPNGIMLGFKSWILPGDGAVISISKNGINN